LLAVAVAHPSTVAVELAVTATVLLANFLAGVRRLNQKLS
jgi:hypothetical protein